MLLKVIRKKRKLQQLKKALERRKDNTKLLKIVIVCWHYRNTSPSVVKFLTTRRAKTVDLHISDSSAPSDLIVSFITEEVETIDDTAEVEETDDARKVLLDNLEALDEGTKG